ncbi:MAG: MMPL family transporter [bacterium]
MNFLANLVTRRAWLVLGGVLIVISVGLYNGIWPEPEDDILEFLPPEDPDVRMFRRISATFGGLEVGMIGIETKDVFDPAFLKRLDVLTADLRDTDGVDRVVSLTNLADFEPDHTKRGIKAGELVDVRQFVKADYLKRLRARVLGKEHVVGQFVDKDARSTLVLTFLVPGVNQQQVVGRIREVTRRHMGAEKVYWGGAPFASSYIFETTDSDLRLLTPWALAAIILVMLIAFRDFVGVVLSLFSTGVGAIVAFSLMVAFGVKLNLVLSSMPVILFAVGSAYGIHILSRYYRLAETMEHREAIRGAVLETGPAVLATGLTTMAGFISFVVMDIKPMRLFGLFTAIGIGASMVTALCVIPAMLTVTSRFRKQSHVPGGEHKVGWLSAQLGRLAAASARRRMVTVVIAAVLGITGIILASQVKVEVEPSAFFAEGSEPDLADKFLGRRFGGSQFIQVHIDLDPEDPKKRAEANALDEFFPQVRHQSKPRIEEPLVMREVRRFAEMVQQIPEVSSVLHIGLPVSLGTEMADDLRRIPDTRAKVKNIYGLVSTDPTVNQLLSPSHRDLLVHIKIKSSRIDVVNRVLRRVSAILDKDFRPVLRPVDLKKTRDAKLKALGVETLIGDTAAHVLATARSHGHKTPTAAHAALAARYARLYGKPVAVTARAKRAVAVNMASYLTSSEFPGLWPKETPEGESYDRNQVAARISAALADLGPGASEDARDKAVKGAAGKVIGTSKCLDFSTFLERELGHSWRLQRADQLGLAAVQVLGLRQPSPKLVMALATAGIDLDAPSVAVPHKGGEVAGLMVLRPTVSGMPVVLRGLSRSVERNQILSLIASLGIVLLIMIVMFRSLTGGIIALMPAGLTLVAVFGGLGLVGRAMDISTSMVAGIAIGVGIDYSIHFLTWWKKRSDGDWAASARQAAAESGAGIVANAFMVCAGFAVLAMGRAQPLKVFGVMIAAAMIMAALITFLVIPAIAGRRTYYQRLPSNSEVVQCEETAALAPATSSVPRE